MSEVMGPSGVSPEVSLLGLSVAVSPPSRPSHGCPSVPVCVLVSSYRDSSRGGPGPTRHPHFRLTASLKTAPGTVPCPFDDKPPKL